MCRMGKLDVSAFSKTTHPSNLIEPLKLFVTENKNIFVYLVKAKLTHDQLC